MIIPDVLNNSQPTPPTAINGSGEVVNTSDNRFQYVNGTMTAVPTTAGVIFSSASALKDCGENIAEFGTSNLTSFGVAPNTA